MHLDISRKDNKMVIYWVGPLFSHTGYARHNRWYVYELSQKGIPLRIIPTDKMKYEPIDRADRWIRRQKLEDFFKTRNCISISCMPPPGHIPKTAYMILFTTIESYIAHPALWNRLKLFEEIWYPSQYCYDAVQRYRELPRPQFIMRLGIDENFWTPEKHALRTSQSEVFTACSLFDWGFRKGMMFLLRAWANVYHKIKPAKLILISRYQMREEKKYQKRLRKELKNFLAFDYKNVIDSLHVISHVVKDTEIRKIFRQSDIFILPTLGEGFCLPLCEAQATGLPVITTETGGQTEFIHDGEAITVKIERYEEIEGMTHLVHTFWQDVPFCIPSLEDLQEKIIYARENIRELKAKALEKSEEFRKKWSWREQTKKAYDRLYEIYNSPPYIKFLRL